jgi:hypothetical protein
MLLDFAAKEASVVAVGWKLDEYPSALSLTVRVNVSFCSCRDLILKE